MEAVDGYAISPEIIGIDLAPPVKLNGDIVIVS